MGIYETLYAFHDSYGQFMGTEGTHPWSQGFPLTTPLEKFDGPDLPAAVDVTWEDRFYPKAWGHPRLRQAIANMYNRTCLARAGSLAARVRLTLVRLQWSTALPSPLRT